MLEYYLELIILGHSERTSESTCCCFHRHFSLIPNSKSQTHKASYTHVMKRKVQWISLGAPLSPCCSVLIHARKGETCRTQWLSREGKSALPTDPECLKFLCNLFFYLNLFCSRQGLIYLPASPAHSSEGTALTAGCLSAGQHAREGEVVEEPWERQRLRRNPEPEPAQCAGETGERLASSLARCYKILSKELEVMVD